MMVDGAAADDDGHEALGPLPGLMVLSHSGILECLGRYWGALGAILGAFGALLGPSWRRSIKEGRVVY